MATIEEWSCMPQSSAALGAVAANAGGLFATAVQALLAAQCALVKPDNNPPDRTNDILAGNIEFDFIVVGAGSAGSVVANRLTEVADWNVLLIEAGGDPMLTNQMPIMFYKNLNTMMNWNYITEPSDKVCLGAIDKQCRWPRGKVLGGCSAVNALFYIRGSKEDYEEWEQLGNSGWNYENVLKYFKKSENFSGDNDYYREYKQYHGRGGYLNVEKYKYDDLLSDVIINAQKELGAKEVYEHNGPQLIGVSKAFATVKDGKRVSSAKAFLNSIKERKNLYVIKNALATKIIIDKHNKQATGVKVKLSNGKDYIISASKEVILSGGAVNTPQLLLLSGIGPKYNLIENNIDVIKNLKVGENLQDHITAPVFFEVKKGILKELSLETAGTAYAQYLLNTSSLYGSMLNAEVVQFVNTNNESNDIPDIQYHYLPFHSNDTLLLEPFFKGLGYTSEAIDSVVKLNTDSCLFMVYVVVLKPHSKGKIILKNNNAVEHPLIYPNYYENERDFEIMLKGMEDLEKMADTSVFKEENIKLVKLDYAPCAAFGLRTNDYRKCIAQHYGFTLYHPVGTAKMGPESDPTSVVDNKLRVHGIRRLRVADASIMPTIIRGNTNAPTIMIGERVSDFIKQQWLPTHEEF